MQALRDNALYAYGYLQGRFFSLPRSPAELYGRLVSKATSFISLPLPLLSFLALPFFGGSPATVNFVIFYLTWAAFVASHDQQTVEIGGTLFVRVLCFLLPALSFLAFDCALPRLSRRVKARGERQLPSILSRNKLLEVVGVAVFNVLLSVALQAALEFLATQILHLRSLLKVTAAIPLPWTILKDLAKGLVIRGFLRYSIHRYLLHTYDTPFKVWHIRWQHSIRLPFSLVSAYDHPANHIISQWLPTFAPAYLFRYHVLTWHLLLAITSLEDLFVNSGYAVLPSSIVIPGMARRTDAHFDAVRSRKKVGNFGSLGILDFAFGTTCQDEADVVDDMQSEAAKHRFQERVDDAVKLALAGLKGDQGQLNGPGAATRLSEDPDDENNNDGTSQQPVQRRSNRRKGRH
jgi:hypothetical protein